MKQLIDKFQKLPDRQKKIISYTLLFLICTVIGLYMYYEKQSNIKQSPNLSVNLKDVVPEMKILEKSLYQETIQKNKQLEKALKQMREELTKTQQQLTKSKELQRKELEATIKKLEEAMKKNIQQGPIKNVPPPASKVDTTKDDFNKLRSSNNPIPPVVVEGQNNKKQGPIWVGGILEEENEEKPKKNDQVSQKQEQQEKNKAIYLPPSFVSGDLLSGFAAFASEKGKSEPVRAIIRISDLAILPNNIKADLKGCFAIGEAYANLADERAHVRLLRLSCIAKDGSSVIDEPIKGWVVDEDGKSGLKGRVVAKFGSFMARYFLAGFLQGFGDAYSNMNTAIDYSGDGVIQFPNPDDAAKAGIGKGIGNIGKGLADFYLDLAKQTLPVVEIGAGKKVTIVFTEGKELKIKKTCIKGRNGCKQETQTNGYGALINLD